MDPKKKKTNHPNKKTTYFRNTGENSLDEVKFKHHLKEEKFASGPVGQRTHTNGAICAKVLRWTAIACFRN